MEKHRVNGNTAGLGGASRCHLMSRPPRLYQTGFEKDSEAVSGFTGERRDCSVEMSVVESRDGGLGRARVRRASQMSRT